MLTPQHTPSTPTPFMSDSLLMQLTTQKCRLNDGILESVFGDKVKTALDVVKSVQGKKKKEEEVGGCGVIA